MRTDANSRPSFGMLCLVWIALVAVAVVGRLWRPAANVTPLAGAAIAAGAVFPHPLAAATVPLAALSISNLALPGYGPGAAGTVMACVVYAAVAWPVLLGGVVRSGRLTSIVGGALASSLVFFLATNFAHWWLSEDYPHTAAGLVACYAAGLPFYRWMPVGDVAWTLLLLSTLASFGARAEVGEPISTPPGKAA